MKFLKTAAACGLALATLATASDVHDLKQDGFDEFLNTYDLTMVEFYAPWCGHCKALAPEYETAATTLKEKNIPLTKVDCVANDELCKRYDIDAYPAVRIFRGPDNLKPYPGARKADAIISYMVKQQLPAVSLLTSDTLEGFKTADKVVLVGFFASNDKTANETFSKTADALRDTYLFGSTSDAALAKAEGVKQPAIVLYKSFDEGKSIFEETFDVEAITKFAKTAATPLVGEVNPETYGNYMRSGVPLAYIFSDTPEERAELALAFKPIAEKHKGKINFATLDAKAFGAHASNLNLPVGVWPAFAIQETIKNKKYPFEGQDLSIDKITPFVDDFAAGKLVAAIKSEPVPEKQDGPVLKIVANNFDEIVMDDTKDVFVEYYAPWCSHCKAMAPQWERLAELYTNDSEFKDKIVMAKCDATQNDVPEEIQGFPLIKIYPAGAKDSPIAYRGSRTVQDMSNFVRENGKYKLDVWAKVGHEEEAEEEEEDDEEYEDDEEAEDADGDVEMQEVVSAAAETAAKAAPAATKAASDASSAASSGASSVATDASSSASSASEEVSSSATSVASDASSVAKDASSSVTSAASSASSGIAEAIVSAVTEAAEAVYTVVADTDDGEVGHHDEL